MGVVKVLPGQDVPFSFRPQATNKSHKLQAAGSKRQAAFFWGYGPFASEKRGLGFINLN
jgi:hypothetical protein